MNVTERRKQGSYFKLSADTKEKIKVIAEEKHMSQANTIAHLVDNYFADRKGEDLAQKQMMEELLDVRFKEIADKLSRMQVTSNVIDRDTKIILEFMNHYYLVNKFKQLITTEEYKTKGMEQAEQLIQKRIQKQRKKKLDHEQQKKSKQQHQDGGAE